MQRSCSSRPVLVFCVLCAVACSQSTSKESAGGGNESAGGSGGESKSAQGGQDNPTPAQGGAAGANAGGFSSAQGGTNTAPGGQGGALAAGGAPAAGGQAGSAVAGTCVFCEDFETGSLNKAVWEPTVSDGNSLAVEGGKVHSGKFALHLHGNGTASFVLIRNKKMPASLQEHQFGRAYMWFTPQGPGGHTSIVWGGNEGRGFPFQDNHIQIASADALWRVGWWFGGAEDFHVGKQAIETNKWLCLEWEFRGSDDRGLVWVDGKSVIGYSTTSGGNVKTLDQLGIGYRMWHPQGKPVDLFVDDVAVGTSRMGCM